MKKKISTLFLLVFIATNGVAVSWTDAPDTLHRFRISIDSDYFFASNSISNQFAKDYYQDKFITNSRKDEVSNSLSAFNRFGIQNNSRLSFSFKPTLLFGSPNSWLTLSLSDHYQISSQFKKDVFELYFRGNKLYEDKKADLSHFSFDQIHYQQFSVGFSHAFIKNEQAFSCYAGLSLTKGNTFLSIKAPSGSLYTAMDGDYIDLEADLNIRRNDSSSTHYNAWNGTGLASDFQFNWTDENKGQWSVSVMNLGFMNWSNKSTYIKADTSFRFNGVDVTDFFNFTDSVKTNVNLDSSLVQPYLTDRTTKKYTALLPGFFSINYRGKFGANTFFIFSADQYWMSNYIPAVKFSPGYQLNHHAFILMTRYGGYGQFFAGIGYEYNYNGWNLGLKSEYLSSAFSKKGKGQGAVFHFSKSF